MTLHGDELDVEYRQLVADRSETYTAEAGGGSVQREPQAVGGAGGADEDRSLVVIGSSSADRAGAHCFSGTESPNPGPVDPSLKRLLSDRARVLIAETCGDLKEAKQLRTCGVNVVAGASDVAVQHHPDGYAFTTGLQTCSSVWACPICSFKIRLKRAAEIAVAIAAHHDRGGSVLLLTVTTSHGVDEGLATVWDDVQGCWEYVTSHSRYRKLKNKLGLGFIRSTEVMHGRNGWHPHLHVLLFSDTPIDPWDTRDLYHEIGRVFHDLWIGRMRDKYGRNVRSSYGIDLRMVKPDDSEGVGTYCTKAGYEVAMADGKEGRTRTSRHPFAIAYDAVETGDTEAIALFREWVQGSHGRRMWSWSQGLRDASGLGQEKTDEELAAEADETVGEICVIDRTLWRRIATTRTGLRARFLTALDTGSAGLAAAVELLQEHGLVVRVQTRSSGSPPRLLGPPTKPNKQREPSRTNQRKQNSV